MAKKNIDQILEEEKAKLKEYRGLEHLRELQAVQQRRKAYLNKFRKELNNHE